MIKTIPANTSATELEAALRLAEEVWMVDSNNKMGPNNDREWLELVAGAPLFADENVDGAPAAHEPEILQIIVDSTDPAETNQVRSAVLEILAHRAGPDRTPVS